jgi:DNA replication protein DnaD
MARAIFDYTKTVLKKVSFDTELFCKELEKAVKRLLPFEIEELRLWLLQFTANRPELFVCMAVIKN